MVNRQDLEGLGKTIMENTNEGFGIMRKDLQKEMRVMGEQLKKEGEQLKKEVVDLRKMVEAKVSDLEARVEALEGGDRDTMTIVQGAAFETRLAELEGKEDQGVMMEAVLEEFQQMESRKKSIAVFGMKEEEESGETDETACKKLLEEIGETADFQSYRTGPRVQERQRTVIMKFQTEAQKEKVLEKARNLKGKTQYKKITLAPDQTKQQRQLNKKKEAALKTEAEKRNAALTEEEKNEGKWGVWGRGEGRHLVRKRN
jgi:hypothetical protein